MTELVIPAPLWRRLAASLYDALLFLGAWMAVLWLDVVVRDLGGWPVDWMALRALFFLVGLGFFGWFWTHGGQTLGMRAWRLRVRRDDGAPLRWVHALPRYAVAWLSWAPAGLGMLWCLRDARRRAWHDIASGCEVVVVPKAQ